MKKTVVRVVALDMIFLLLLTVSKKYTEHIKVNTFTSEYRILPKVN